MNSTLGIIVKRIIRESWDHKMLVTVLFVITSILFLLLALVWPRVYTSSSTILVDEHNILRPLMEGTAVTTGVVDRSKRARQVVFSRAAMSKILDSENWFDESEATPAEKERKIEEIKRKTSFDNAGKNLLRISFKNQNPERAWKVAQLMTDIFVDTSLLNKQKESSSAHNFIDKQVNNYHQKLKIAESALKDFRSLNMDSRPGSQKEVNAKISNLRGKRENYRLDILSEESRVSSLTEELTGGAVITASNLRIKQLQDRIVLLKNKLDELRLSYHDTYPDIVQLNEQIGALNEQISTEKINRNREPDITDIDISNDPIFSELRGQLSKAKTRISSLKSQEKATTKLLEAEQKRIERINGVDAELSELTRDYKVNQDIYQRLLKQREQAYISMEIDIEKQGLTIKIQEMATLPITPKGIRFAHIILAGLVFSVLVPLGIVFGLSILDEKVRDQRIIIDKLGLPVLASVYYVNTSSETKKNYYDAFYVLLSILIVWSIYGYAIWERLQG